MTLRWITVIALLSASPLALATVNVAPAGKTTLQLNPEMHKQQLRHEVRALEEQISDLEQQIATTHAQAMATRGVFGSTSSQTAALEAQAMIMELQKNDLKVRHDQIQDGVIE